MIMDRPQQDRGPRVNDRIRVREVRLIDANGDQLGILPTEQAMARAREQGLDLVEVAEKSRPPVCKIMDYGKYKYELKLKKRQNAKKQHKVILKEVRIRPKTGEHDYQVKVKNARRFLNKGYKVQINVLFRGRERVHTEIAKGHLERMARDLEDVARVEVFPKMEGYRMFQVMAPLHQPKEKTKDSQRVKKSKGKSKRRRGDTESSGEELESSEDSSSEDSSSEDSSSEDSSS